MIRRVLPLALSLFAAGCSTTGPIAFECRGLEGDKGYAQPQPQSAYVRQIRGQARPGGLPRPPAGLAEMMAPVEAAAPVQGSAPVEDGKAPVLTLEQALQQSEQEAKAVEKATVNAHAFAEGWSFTTPNQPISADLLLSGGGQWGAYGAGFLSRLHAKGFDRNYHFGTVTGVSTGAFQALFVGAGGDEDFRALSAVYAPPSEAYLVRRYRPTMLAAVTGEMAAIARLRVRLEDALCSRALLAQSLKAGQSLSPQAIAATCPMIARLARSGGTKVPGLPAPPALSRNVFVGMVRADDGEFMMANATRIAQDLFTADAVRKGISPASVRNAQQCLAGIGLASAAMPLFYQQVQIADPGTGGKKRTYYDGGVRQSVFEAELAQARQSAENKRPIFVLRNGPTALLKRIRAPGSKVERDVPGADEKVNNTANPLDAAMRAEKIVVNQVEVQSIADLRLTNPDGPVYFTTADGFHDFTPSSPRAFCAKRNKDIMFDDLFMLCLRDYGVTHADRGTSEKLLLDAWTRLVTAQELKRR